MQSVAVIAASILILLMYLAVLVLLWQNQTSMSLSSKEQRREIQRLTHLLVSKDLPMYSTLQTLTNQQIPQRPKNPPNVDPNFVPRDDVSMANYLAGQYEMQGLDPHAAYAGAEEAVMDFGGPGEFR